MPRHPGVVHGLAGALGTGPPMPRVTGVRPHPALGGRVRGASGIRTRDLRVMSPSSYRAAPSRYGVPAGIRTRISRIPPRPEAVALPLELLGTRRGEGCAQTVPTPGVVRYVGALLPALPSVSVTLAARVSTLLFREWRKRGAWLLLVTNAHGLSPAHFRFRIWSATMNVERLSAHVLPRTTRSNVVTTAPPLRTAR